MKTAITELEIDTDEPADEESKPEEKEPETLAQRVERELDSLREFGFVKKDLPAITRSTLDKLTPQSRIDFLKAGGKLINDPPPAKTKLPAGAATRSAFMKMTHEQKLAFAKSGAKLFDDQDVTTGSA